VEGHNEKFFRAKRRTGAPTICYGANGVYRSTVEQRWAIILRQAYIM